MKQTIIFLLTTLFGASISAQEFYNLDAYPEKQFYTEKQPAKPAKFGAYAQINGGLSPTHPQGFAGLTLGIVQRYGELSAMALPSVTGTGLHVFTGMIGLRAPINKVFTVTPKIGYWTYWNSKIDKPIQWTGGNRFVYGVDINKRIEGNLELVISWIDCRSHIGQYNGMKIGTAGLRYTF